MGGRPTEADSRSETLTLVYFIGHIARGARFQFARRMQIFWKKLDAQKLQRTLSVYDDTLQKIYIGKRSLSLSPGRTARLAVDTRHGQGGWM